MAAGRVRAAGRSVAVIDSRPFGGTCALRGCDPKKVLVAATSAVDHARRMDGKGIAGAPHIDWLELIAFKRTFTGPVPGNRERSFSEDGIAAYHGEARFSGPRSLTVVGEELEARFILIATGAAARPLRIPGEEYLITSEGFMAIESLPRRIVMVGGGYIAAEFSHIAARAGAKVTILQRGDRTLGHLVRALPANSHYLFRAEPNLAVVRLRSSAVVVGVGHQSDGINLGDVLSKGLGQIGPKVTLAMDPCVQLFRAGVDRHKPDPRGIRAGPKVPSGVPARPDVVQSKGTGADGAALHNDENPGGEVVTPFSSFVDIREDIGNFPRPIEKWRLVEVNLDPSEAT